MTRTKPPNPTDVIGNPRGCCCCSGSNPTRPGTLHTSVPGQGRMQAPSLDPLPMTKVSIVRPIRIYAIEPRDPAISPALPLVVVCSKKRLCSEYHIFGTCPHSLAQIPVFLPMPQSTRQTQAQATTFSRPRQIFFILAHSKPSFIVTSISNPLRSQSPIRVEPPHRRLLFPSS
ncbi:unnamed protein product [Fusarium fujikuroi]|uniref:Uncharacterized protein n=1 Tax=Fusarium fujikuroi TaxID=5127 RepID=A0A9Q9UFP7_FUSFU|nr:unnamed protein product [Fusarium fujikuroi]